MSDPLESIIANSNDQVFSQLIALTLDHLKQKDLGRLSGFSLGD